MKNLSLMVKYVFITPWCRASKLLWYKVIILSVHVSGIARTVVSFSDDILNNNESNKTYFSASASNFLIADFKVGSLFCDTYKYKSLKYGLHKYPVWISLTSMGRCVPFNAFLCITSSTSILSMCDTVLHSNTVPQVHWGRTRHLAGPG